MPLNARGLTFGYTRDTPILRGLSLTVEPGESVSVMAPSGAGKSTLLALLGGLLQPWEGEVELTVGADGAARTLVAWVFQRPRLMTHRTALDNVTIAALAQGYDRREAEARARTALGEFGVAALAGRRARHISGGEAQRVALARAAVASPALVLADEPTANLDRTSADAVAATLLRGYRRSAVVMVTHDPRIAAAATRQLELIGGDLVPMETNP